MFPGAENIKKRKAVMEFPAWKSIFSCFYKKYFARCMHPGRKLSKFFVLNFFLAQV